MLTLAVEKLRETKWDPDMRELFKEITGGDIDLIDSLDVTQMQDEYDTMSLNMKGIMIPLVGNQARFESKIR